MGPPIPPRRSLSWRTRSPSLATSKVWEDKAGASARTAQWQDCIFSVGSGEAPPPAPPAALLPGVLAFSFVLLADFFVLLAYSFVLPPSESAGLCGGLSCAGHATTAHSLEGTGTNAGLFRRAPRLVGYATVAPLIGIQTKWGHRMNSRAAK